MTSYLNKGFQDLGNVISTEIVKNVTSDFEEFDKCLYKTCVLLKGKNYDEVNSRPIVALDHDDLEDSEKIKYLAFLSGLKTWEESKINHEIDFQSLSRQSSLELHGFGQFSPCLTATYMGYSIVEKIVKCETEAIQKTLVDHVLFLKNIPIPNEKENYMNFLHGTYSQNDEVWIISNREKKSLQDIIDNQSNQKILLKKKFGYINQIIQMLILLSKNKTHHLGLHPHNVLISEKNKVKLSDIGFNRIIPYIPYEGDGAKYIDPTFGTKPFEKVSEEELEKYDVYSVAQIAQTFISIDLSEADKKNLRRQLQPFLEENIQDRLGLNDLSNKFQDTNFLDSLYGEVDSFWKHQIKDTEVELRVFANKFLHYFNQNIDENEIRNIVQTIDELNQSWDKGLLCMRMILNCKIELDNSNPKKKISQIYCQSRELFKFLFFM